VREWCRAWCVVGARLLRIGHSRPPPGSYRESGIAGGGFSLNKGLPLRGSLMPRQGTPPGVAAFVAPAAAKKKTTAQPAQRARPPV